MTPMTMLTQGEPPWYVSPKRIAFVKRANAAASGTIWIIIRGKPTCSQWERKLFRLPSSVRLSAVGFAIWVLTHFRLYHRRPTIATFSCGRCWIEAN
jgi:hypothetical protein